MKTRFVSFGRAVPKKVYTNKDLEKLMDTSDEWIQQRSGILERRWISEGETASSMAKEAAEQAIQRAGISVDDVDAIVYACLLSDYIFPGGGCQMQHLLGFKKPIPALDVRNQCAGFLYSLNVADAWIRAGFYKRVLIIGSEIHSTSMDITTRGRDIAVLFGDGAAACIVEAAPDSSEAGVIETFIASEGEFAKVLSLTHPTPNEQPRFKHAKPEIPENWYPQMEGRLVFKHAITRMSEAVGNLVAKHGFKTDDVDFVIAHQANKRIIQMVLETLKIPESKTHYTLDRFGNTTAATIPLTLDEAVQQGKIKKGSLVVLTAFGSGFTWGASLVRF